MVNLLILELLEVVGVCTELVRVPQQPVHIPASATMCAGRDTYHA